MPYTPQGYPVVMTAAKVLCGYHDSPVNPLIRWYAVSGPEDPVYAEGSSLKVPYVSSSVIGPPCE